MLALAKDQLIPAMEHMYTAAQQLDIPLLLKNLPLILQKNGLCQFTPEAIAKFSSSTEHLLVIFDSLDASQLADLTSDQLASLFFQQRTAAQLPVKSVKLSGQVRAQIPGLNADQLPSQDFVKLPSLDSVKVPNIESAKMPSLESLQLPSMADIKLPNMADVKLPSLESLQLPSLVDVQLPSWEAVKLPTVQGLTNFFSGPDSPVIYTLRHLTSNNTIQQNQFKETASRDCSPPSLIRE